MYKENLNYVPFGIGYLDIAVDSVPILYLVMSLNILDNSEIGQQGNHQA